MDRGGPRSIYAYLAALPQPRSRQLRDARVERATVADAMYVGIVTCPPGASLAIVARTMASHTMAVRRAVSVVATAPLSKAVGFMFVHGVTHVVVTDADARPIGGLSTFDIAGMVAWRRT